MNTLVINGKRYRVDEKRVKKVIFSFFVAILMTVLIQKYATPKTLPAPVSAASAVMLDALPSLPDFSSSSAPTPDTSVSEEEERFISQMKNLFQLDAATASSIYENAKKYNLPPYFSAGIAHQETHFHPEATGPTTKFGTARGMYQIIESTAWNLLGIHDANSLYDAETAIESGNQVLHTYENWLSGVTDDKTPEVFKHFSLENGQVLYKGKVVRDQNGKPVPLLLLTAIAYNAGPGAIPSALDKDGKLIMNPKQKNHNIPMQSLDYVIQISKIFNFEYAFAYSEHDIDRSKLF